MTLPSRLIYNASQLKQTTESISESTELLSIAEVALIELMKEKMKKKRN